VQVTNGSRVEVSETGTSLTFVPGLLIGGRIEQVKNVRSQQNAVFFTIRNTVCGLEYLSDFGFSLLFGFGFGLVSNKKFRFLSVPQQISTF
jgi:hypothetical protein